MALLSHMQMRTSGGCATGANIWGWRERWLEESASDSSEGRSANCQKHENPLQNPLSERAAGGTGAGVVSLLRAWILEVNLQLSFTSSSSIVRCSWASSLTSVPQFFHL